MGNANTTNAGGGAGGHRERNKSGDSVHNHPSSPLGIGRGADGQAFTFDKKTTPTSTLNKPHQKIIIQTSHDLDDEPPFYTSSKSSSTEDTTEPPPYAQDEGIDDDFSLGRTRSRTISEGNPSISSSTKSPTPKFCVPTVFKWDAGGKQVFISGTFSDWKTIPMVKRFGLYSHGDFVTILDLPEGEHEYKFLIDGEWKYDPNEPTKENAQGITNNVITVKKTDFEVFDALDVDSNTSSTNTTNESSGGGSNNLKTDYGQDIPSYKPWEKTSGPPILPPHLLQVILNKDTPLSCEPTLLPEPNHVMLNHLYALSIKDGVMVLSATHRYRKKYVTTLLYKPI